MNYRLTNYQSAFLHFSRGKIDISDEMFALKFINPYFDEKLLNYICEKNPKLAVQIGIMN